MIEPANPDLPIGRQCQLLSFSRSLFYYQPTGETALNLALMGQIDQQFLETPFFGARQTTWRLRNERPPRGDREADQATDAPHRAAPGRLLRNRLPGNGCRSIRSPTPARRRRGTRLILICCAVCS